MNVALYLRKSRIDLEMEKYGEGETLTRHETILKELCKKQNHNIIHIYREIVSGESISNRPQMQLLLQAVQRNEYDGIVVMEIERLARGNTTDQGVVADAFKYSNTKIITPVKTYNPNNEFDEEFFEFGLFMSRREYKTITRRLQTGRIQSQMEGNFIHNRPPYGYNLSNPKPHEHVLIPNEQESAVVRMIFEEYLNGTGLEKIANKLSEMGIPTKFGKSEWGKATIKGILTNPVYIGKIHFNKGTKTNVNGKVKYIHDKNNTVIVDGKHEPIVPVEVFEAAKARMQHSVPTDRERIINPLAGLAHCAKCGRPFTYIHYSKYNRYKSTTDRLTHQRVSDCWCKSIPITEVVNSLVENLKTITEEFEISIVNEEKPNNVNVLTNELNSVKTQYEGLFDKLERGIYTEEEFINRKKIVLKRINSLERELKDEIERVEHQTVSEERKFLFTECIDLLNDDSVPVAAKNDFLKKIIKDIRITVTDLGRNHGSDIKLDLYL